MRNLSKKELIEINGGDANPNAFMAGREFAEDVMNAIEETYHAGWDFLRGVWDTI